MRWYCLCMLWACAAGEAAQDPAVACSAALRDDARFAAITQRLPLADLRTVSAEMRADSAYPDAQESTAISAWVQARRTCMAQGAEFRRLHVPQPLVEIEGAAEARLAAAAGELAARKLTYGAFAARALEIGNEAHARRLAVVRELRQQRQMSGQGQRQTEWLARQQAGREARWREQAAATARRERDAAARQAAQERSLAAQQAGRDALARDALARSAVDTQRLLNSIAPPTQPAIAPAVPVPPGVNCYATGVDWRCSPR
jgi:hypothetical protein